MVGDATSRQVCSAQLAPYQRLPDIVSKHIECGYHKPIQDHNMRAFEQLLARLATHRGPRLLDSCCGTGMSTYQQAKACPDTLVVGIDRSQDRLGRGANAHAEPLPNCLLLRADCEDIWRLCVQEQVLFDRHTIYYPNPYPKNKHFNRRWHGHPVFPALAQLSHGLEVRSNWRLYLQEFSAAWHLLTGNPGQLSQFEPQHYMTLFEKKYHQSGQPVFRWSI